MVEFECFNVWILCVFLMKSYEKPFLMVTIICVSYNIFRCAQAFVHFVFCCLSGCNDVTCSIVSFTFERLCVCCVCAIFFRWICDVCGRHRWYRVFHSGSVRFLFTETHVLLITSGSRESMFPNCSKIMARSGRLLVTLQFIQWPRNDPLTNVLTDVLTKTWTNGRHCSFPMSK